SLASAEPFSDLLDFDLPGEQVYKASKALVPRSTYVPNPSFTNEARQAKFNGTMVLRVVVSEEGESHPFTSLERITVRFESASIEYCSNLEISAGYDGWPARVGTCTDRGFFQPLLRKNYPP